MELPPDLKCARFVTRLNRFAALMQVEGEETLVHVVNSGRLHELLRPENPMLIAPAYGTHRKTTYDLVLVEVGGVLVSADATVPNVLVKEAIEGGRLPELAEFEHLTREAYMGSSRADILLSGRAGQCYVEVKSVTLVEDGVGLFPDSPTARGTRHILSLQQSVEEGHRAAVFFVIQRPDARWFSPNQAADPGFAQRSDRR